MYTMREGVFVWMLFCWIDVFVEMTSSSVSMERCALSVGLPMDGGSTILILLCSEAFVSGRA